MTLYNSEPPGGPRASVAARARQPAAKLRGEQQSSAPCLPLVPHDDILEPLPATLAAALGAPVLDTGFVMSVGDLASEAKGSGARATGGKPDLSLIPLDILGLSYIKAPGAAPKEVIALLALGEFQRTHAPGALYAVLDALGDGWESCARVFAYGKKKYNPWNWAKGMAWNIPVACAARHLRKMLAGELLDVESGEEHRGHVYCNIVMLLQYIKTYPEGNDLPRAGLL